MVGMRKGNFVFVFVVAFLAGCLSSWLMSNLSYSSYSECYVGEMKEMPDSGYHSAQVVQLYCSEMLKP